MNVLENIWKHPRTTASGLLIAVSTVAGVLAQSGVTLGHVGSGNAVTLAGALAAALLGLLARDPGGDGPASGTSGSSGQVAGVTGSSKAGSGGSGAQATSTSGAILRVGVVAALLLPLPLLDGCTGKSVAQDIVNWTPALQSAVATLDSTAAVIAPENEQAFAAVTAGFDAASNLLTQQAKAYLANPNATTLGQLQTQVVTFQQQVNAALLTAAKIVNPASQQRALTAVQAVATAVAAILALVESISSGSAVAEMAAASAIKMAQVEPLMNPAAEARMVAAHYGEPVEIAAAHVERARAAATQAGF
jgi:hypothetical protein